jgi:hypothetical protein
VRTLILPGPRNLTDLFFSPCEQVLTLKTVMAKFSARPEPRRKRRSKKPAAKYTPAAVHAPAVAIAVANRKHTSKRTRTKTTVKPHGSLLAFVYVGNVSLRRTIRFFQGSTDSFPFREKLRADVQNADLERLFKPEDDQDEESRVTKIDIRCGFGNVVPSKCGTPVYATVVFRGVGGATKAMDKNGHTLLGKKIIVSRDNLLMLPLPLMSYLAGLP